MFHRQAFCSVSANVYVFCDFTEFLNSYFNKFPNSLLLLTDKSFPLS